MESVQRNIVIYPHLRYNNNDGGTTVHYYLADILDSFGRNVKICNVHDNNTINNIFNKFININEIDVNNDIIIYCEGINGNPLNARYVVRWMLSKLGTNVPSHYYNTWNKNELVYFFNSENELIDKNVPFKQLTLFFINPAIKNLNGKRSGTCFTKRKSHIHPNATKLHSDNSFEITRGHTQDDYINIFNKYESFVSYDPLTFLNIIATLCGCVSIIAPIKGVTKQEYFKMTALYNYMIEKKTDIYGLAYGSSQEEIQFSKNTLHLVGEQIKDIQNWFIDTYIKSFLNDLDNFENNYNKLSEYKNVMLPESYLNQIKNLQGELHFDNRKAAELTGIEDFDIFFYKYIHSEFSNINDFGWLVEHFNSHGKFEGRLYNKKQASDLIGIEDFDILFYKHYYSDLTDLSYQQLIHHFITHGKSEGRLYSNKQFAESLGEIDFNPIFYKRNNPDLMNMSLNQIYQHFKNFGKKEGRICCI
jgi:hypothetical protein